MPAAPSRDAETPRETDEKPLNMKAEKNKAWSGRFTQPADEFVERFTQSVSFDQRLAPYDIRGSIAHATMLARVGALSAAERDQIVEGLQGILEEIEAGRFQWREDLEDVHLNIEAALVKRIGAAGKKVHTGRSRNDQVATDLRLFLRDEVKSICSLLRQNMALLADLAEREAHTLMPGLTHLQAAQPVVFGHHVLAWHEMLKRDHQRFQDSLPRLNALPLGAAALAGTRFPIDRDYAAELLGFESVAENSLDAVSDRDFVVEFCANAALVMMHLSRFSEELVLWMSAPFGFIDIADAFCTGSSIMPQKKNPDVAELARGKTGRVYGDLFAMLTVMKGQPLAYNRDNQEDKELLFDAVDTVKLCLEAYARLTPSVQVQREAMAAALEQGHLTATDLADYLVLKGVPFRDAHAYAGGIARRAIERGCRLEQLELAELRTFCPAIEADVYDCLSPQASVAARNHVGGTAPEQVKQAAARAREWLAAQADDADADQGGGTE